MEIIISNNANKPIYEQITSQIKAMIMSGELQAGDAIPSMRALAKSIHVSVITVQKAYEDLQRDGFIETTVGREASCRHRTKNSIRKSSSASPRSIYRPLLKSGAPAISPLRS